MRRRVALLKLARAGSPCLWCAARGEPCRSQPIAVCAWYDALLMARLPGGQGSDPPESSRRVGDSTARMVSPLAAVLVGHVVETAHEESAAAREAGRAEVAADIDIRLALLAGDVFADPAGAIRHLAASQSHPLAPLLAADVAIAAGDPEAFEVASRERPPVTARGALDLAESWLYRFNDARRAEEVARRGELASDGSGDALFELRCVALARLGEWARLASLLSSQSHKLRAMAEAAHVLFDRLNDRDGAGELIAVCAGVEVGRPDAQYHLELLVGDMARTPGERKDSLERRLAMLRSDPDLACEHYAVKVALADQTIGADAAIRLGVLTDVHNVDWEERAAIVARFVQARDAGDWPTVVGSLEELADKPGAGRLATAYLRRAAEVCAVRAADPARALGLWRRLLEREPGDPQASREIELLLMDQPAKLLAHFEALAESLPPMRAVGYRRAAAVAEVRLKDAARAIALSERAGLRNQARLHRMAGDKPRLIEAYRDLAVSSSDERISSALLCAVGLIELSRGREKPGEQSLVAASRLAPGDVVVLSALADLYRQNGRWQEFSVIASKLADAAQSSRTRVATLSLLGRTLTDLGDVRAARDAYERVLLDEPDRPEALDALAALSEREGKWDRSIELRERAAELAGGAQAVALLVEVARLREVEINDEDGALAAYERALAIDPSAPAALQGAGRHYRALARWADYLDVIDSELELAPSRARQLELWIARAQCAQALRRDPSEAIDCFQRALAIEPNCEPALEGIAALGAQTDRWATVARAYRGARPTPGNLAVLASALMNMGSWLEYSEVRNRELDMAQSAAARARISRELGEVYERELGDDDAAIAAYRKALEFDPGDAEARMDLERLLEESGRWQELAEAYGDELEAASTDPERRAELLLRLGEVQLDHLDNLAAAVTSYEQVLAIAPGNRDAIAALERIYPQLGRREDFALVLEMRADAADDRRERSRLWLRIAELRRDGGDADGAIDAYSKAFFEDPTDRDVFQTLERLSYAQGRWDLVNRVYAAAIDVVENRGEQVYQLADLYARRGYVELNYLHRVDAATHAYARAVQLDPAGERAFDTLEGLYEKHRNWEELVRLYELRAAALGSTQVSVDMFRRAARVAGRQLKQRTTAAAFYERLLGMDPADPEARDAVERQYRSAEDWEKLLESLESRLKSRREGDPGLDLLKEIARACEEGLRDGDRAIAAHRRVLEVEPDERDSLEALGRIYEYGSVSLNVSAARLQGPPAWQLLLRLPRPCRSP